MYLLHEEVVSIGHYYAWLKQKLKSILKRKQPPEVFCKKRCSAKFIGKHLCQSLFLIKLLASRPKRLWHRCFPVNFVKFLRIPLLQNTSGRVLLTNTQSCYLRLSDDNQRCTEKCQSLKIFRFLSNRIS